MLRILSFSEELDGETFNIIAYWHPAEPDIGLCADYISGIEVYKDANRYIPDVEEYEYFLERAEEILND